MELIGNTTYTVLKADGTTVTFKFIGNLSKDNTYYGLVNGEHKPIYEILSGGYLAHWEEPDHKD